MANDLMDLIDQERKNSPEPPRPVPRQPSSSAISKSERVRRYLRENPNKRNVEVVEALRQFGVKSADVANVKAAQRRKVAKGKGAAREAVSKDKPAKAAAPAAGPVELEAKIDVDLLELAVEFVRKAGGMNEAQHVLNLVRRIRAL
jgi:hypothetical protein